MKETIAVDLWMQDVHGCTLSSLCLLHFQVAILQGGTITFLNVMDGSMEYRDMKGSKDI
jgi:hypothetical protein